MTKPQWLDPKVSLGNIISWMGIFASVIYTVAIIQSDVRALQSFRDRAEQKIDRFEVMRASDREALVEMRGDIKLIRQLLENQRRSAP